MQRNESETREAGSRDGRVPLGRGAVVAIALALAACGGDGGTDPGEELEEFAATLTPGAIVGATVVSSATGSASFEYDETDLAYLLGVQNMDNIIQAHIHGPSGTGQNADVLVTLFQPDTPTGLVNGALVSNTIPPGSPLLAPGITLDRILQLIRADSAFVMVHSTEYPDGEIRGHLVP